MTTKSEAKLDIERAKRIWEEYERTHDLTGKERMAVGIDPDCGEVFFGTSAMDIVKNLQKAGQFRPLFYRWVHSPYYHRKVGRRIVRMQCEDVDTPIVRSAR